MDRLYDTGNHLWSVYTGYNRARGRKCARSKLTTAQSGRADELIGPRTGDGPSPRDGREWGRPWSYRANDRNER